MAVPSSGPLRLRGDIALEVYGTATGSNISLRAMSNEAGFNVPDSMSEFYGYSSAVAPSVTTNNATSPNETFFTANGNVTSDGEATITQRGFYVGTNSASPTNNTKYTVTGTTGVYSRVISGLTPNTTYYIWAFATNSVGTTYGSRITQATIPAFVPTYTTNQQQMGVDYNNDYGFDYGNTRILQVWGYYKNPNTNAFIQFVSATKNVPQPSSQNYVYTALTPYPTNTVIRKQSKFDAGTYDYQGAFTRYTRFFNEVYKPSDFTINTNTANIVLQYTGTGVNGGNVFYSGPTIGSSSINFATQHYPWSVSNALRYSGSYVDFENV